MIRSKKPTLKTFCMIAAILAVAWMTCLPREAQAASLFADLVVLNGNVLTIDDDNPKAEAIAVMNDRIVAVGTTSEIRGLVGENTKIIDAKGKTIVPGFIDAHCHPMPLYPFASLLDVVDLSPESVKTMEDLIGALREKAQTTRTGTVVLGGRYEDTKLGRHPTRWDLDKASTDHPILIAHSSGHVGVANSKALEIAGIGKDTPDPAGGSFDRGEDGEPTGMCRELAFKAVNAKLPPDPPSRDQALTEIDLFTRHCVSKGITGIGDAKVTPALIELYQDALDKGRLNGVRVNMMIMDDYLPDLQKLKMQTGFGDENLRIGAIKIFHGNSLSGRTCWLSEPYDVINPATGKKDYHGIPPSRSQEELNSLVLSAHESGFQCAIHSNGDREIEMALSAYENALKKLPVEDHRHRIEHCSISTPAILEKTRELEIALVPHSYVFEHGDKMEAYGEERWKEMHPNRTASALGIPVAGSSDFPVSAADPLLRIQSMVTRKSARGKIYGPEQRVSVEQAIRIWTLGSAYATFEDDIKGSIETGKLADFVILSNDPTQVSPDEIRRITVEKTVIGGEIRYERM